MKYDGAGTISSPRDKYLNYDIGTWCRLAGMRNTAGRCVLGTRVRFKTLTLWYICFAVSYQHLLVIPKPRQNCILHIKFFLANDDKWGRYMYTSYSEHLWYLSLVEYSPWSTIIMCLSSPIYKTITKSNKQLFRWEKSAIQANSE